MLIALAVLAAAGLAYVLYRAKRSRESPEAAKDTTPALDAWIADALEMELAEAVLGIRDASTDERRKLSKSLRGDPDPDIVSKIEDKVRSVELEFVKYAHESDTEVTVRVKYEDGTTGTATKRLAASDVPERVREDFDRRSTTRVFRSWVFPWTRYSVA
jgi:hypothetical protein